jgi:hypothetical protein
VRAFFLAEGFYRETFLFYDASTVVRGSFSSVASPLSCFSPSSPPSSWFTLFPPTPAGELGAVSSDALSFSSLSMSQNSLFFFFLFALLYPSCSTWVTNGILIILGSKSSASSIGTMNFSSHSLVISSMSS